MKKKNLILIIALIVLVLLMINPVMASSTVSFADPDATVHKDIYLYNSSGTLLGLYNTTSPAITLSENASYMFVFKPQYSNPLDEPSTFLNSAISWLQTNALALIILAAMGGLFLKRW
jgi:ABC-type glycerol-3-phosphate transport system permease component